MKTLLKLFFIIFFLAMLASCVEDDTPAAGDTTAPTIEAISPDNGESGVSIKTNVTIVFSEALDAATVNNASLNLRTETTDISGSISVAGSSITFDPSTDLAYATEYTLTIGASITDEAGNRTSGSNTLTFTTEGEPDSTSPTIDSIDPEDGATEIAIDATISVTFSEDIDQASVDNNSVLLTAVSSDPVDATITVTNEMITIDPTNALQAGSLYTLTIDTEITDLSGNALESEFTSSFTTDALPAVISSIPEQGAMNVPLTGPFEVTFSEEMDETTISFRFNYSGGNTSAGSIEKQGTTLIITPANPLLQNTDYELSISGADLAGNAMTSSYILDFRTMASNLEVVSITPNDEATDVTIGSSIVIEFSSDVKSASVNNSTIRLLKDGTEDVFTLFSVNGSEVTVDPTDPLIEFETNYEVVVGTGVESSSGGFIAEEVIYHFTTEIVSEDYYYFVKRASDTGIAMIAKLDQEGVVFPGNSVSVDWQKWHFEKFGPCGNRIWNKHFSDKNLDYTAGLFSRVGITTSPRCWRLTRSTTSNPSYYFSIDGAPELFFNIETFETQSEAVSGAENAWVLERLEAK